MKTGSRLLPERNYSSNVNQAPVTVLTNGLLMILELVDMSVEMHRLDLVVHREVSIHREEVEEEGDLLESVAAVDSLAPAVRDRRRAPCSWSTASTWTR